MLVTDRGNSDSAPNIPKGMHVWPRLFSRLVCRSLLLRTHTMNARPHKQSMSELKLRRLTEHNQRLREDLARPRMRVSEASSRCVAPRPLRPRSHPPSLIRYCKTTKDHLVCGAPLLSSPPHRLRRFHLSGVLSARARIRMHHHKRAAIAL